MLKIKNHINNYVITKIIKSKLIPNNIYVIDGL